TIAITITTVVARITAADQVGPCRAEGVHRIEGRLAPMLHPDHAIGGSKLIVITNRPPRGRPSSFDLAELARGSTVLSGALAGDGRHGSRVQSALPTHNGHATGFQNHNPSI